MALYFIIAFTLLSLLAEPKGGIFAVGAIIGFIVYHANKRPQ